MLPLLLLLYMYHHYPCVTTTWARPLHHHPCIIVVTSPSSSPIHITTPPTPLTPKAELLNGQKLQGVLTSNEVQEILGRNQWEAQFPLFTTINGIVNGRLDVSAVVRYKYVWLMCDWIGVIGLVCVRCASVIKGRRNNMGTSRLGGRALGVRTTCGIMCAYNLTGMRGGKVWWPNQAHLRIPWIPLTSSWMQEL